MQANTSKYGDSRITGPYDTVHKNVLQVKGGINDVVIVGELELDRIKSARRQYELSAQKTLSHCFSCKAVSKSAYPDFFKPCEKCKYCNKKQIIKDIPANFK